MAIIDVESGFNPRAVSTKGAVGLMQLMPTTAQQYGVQRREDLFQPEVNLRAGIRHLKDLLLKHDNNWPVVLAAYNAGEQAVTKRGKRIPAFRETLLYVPAVMSRVDTHRLDLADRSKP